uniref:Uncharacterized protein n=1 Tax=Fagus sylvatica TaxID=28930 RepID=A0A2N9FSV0_FAGSY
MKYLSINQDMMAYFEMLSFCANLGYESTKVLYHVVPNGAIKLSRDREVLDMFDQYKKARLYNIPTMRGLLRKRRMVAVTIIGLDECHLKGWRQKLGFMDLVLNGVNWRHRSSRKEVWISDRHRRSWKAPVMGETPWQKRMRQKKAKEMATKVVQNEGKLGLAVHTRSKKQAKNEHQLSKDPKGRGAASSSQLIDASTSTTRPPCREYTAVNQPVQWFKELNKCFCMLLSLLLWDLRIILKIMTSRFSELCIIQGDWSTERGYILSFDVNDERFRKIMLPQSYFDEAFYSDIKSLAVIKGSLAFIVFCNNIDELSGICHIWVMREYGVVESWTKKSVPMDLVDNFYGCTDNGELLIENATGLVSLDPESLNANKLAIEDAQWMAYTPNSMESLVLLDGLNVSSEYED